MTITCIVLPGGGNNVKVLYYTLLYLHVHCVLYKTVLYCKVPFSNITLYCAVQYCTHLYIIVLHCTV